MGSLFLDEDFLRQFNSRYTARSGMSHMTTDSQNKEFLTFVSPTPRLSPRGRNKFSFTNISVIMEKEACSFIFMSSHYDYTPGYHFTKGLTQNLNLRTHLKLEYNIKSLNYIQKNLRFQAWFLLYWTMSFIFLTLSVV